MSIEEITVVDYKTLRDQNSDVKLLDVREVFEFEIAKIEGAILIPLGDIEKRCDELDKTAHYVVHCKSGFRSAEAIKRLQAHGFKHLKNLVGGINAWSQKIDPSIRQY